MSETTPPIGQTSRTSPAAIPSTAESNAHQKPGAARAMNVVTKPTTPLIRNNQPTWRVTTSEAICGTTIAKSPRMTRTIDQEQNPMIMNRLRKGALQARRHRRNSLTCQTLNVAAVFTPEIPTWRPCEYTPHARSGARTRRPKDHGRKGSRCDCRFAPVSVVPGVYRETRAGCGGRSGGVRCGNFAEARLPLRLKLLKPPRSA